MPEEIKMKGSQTVKDFFAETLSHMVSTGQDSMEVDLKFPVKGKNVTCTFEITLLDIQRRLGMNNKMQVYGVKPNGETVLIGDFPMTPRMKAKELVQSYYGGFDEGDESEADDMFYYMLQLIDYYEQNFNITPKELT